MAQPPLNIRAKPRQNSSVSEEWPAVAFITAVVVLGAYFVRPLRDAPVIDDWVYAWSVEQLLRTGHLAVADISSVYPLAQIAWGASFARLFGFSFGVLRISTLVLAWAGCTAFYLTLRELGLTRTASLLGAIALLLDPVFFALSLSFMTDVPLVSIAMIAMLFDVQGIRRRSPGRLWAGSAFAAIAFLIRPLAAALPLATLAALLGRGTDWRRLAFPSLAAGLAMIAVSIAQTHVLGPLEVQAGRYEQLRWWFSVPLRDYAAWNLALVSQAAIPFAPLLLASITTRKRAAAVALAATIVGVLSWWLLGGLPSPMPDWETWSLQDIGARAMVGGDAPVSGWSLRAAPVVRWLGLIVTASLVVGVVESATNRSGGLVLLVFGALNALLINVLWLYNDRYYLVFAPAVAFVGAQQLSAQRAPRVIAIPLLAVLGFFALTGTRDMLDVNDACASVARRLESSGVQPWDIDTGYASNGWRLYVHPENLRPGVDRRYGVPYVTSKTPTTYKIAHTPLPGYDVIETVPLPHAWWQATNRLFVLRRRST